MSSEQNIGNKMQYPTYKREQKLSCKLSDQQISEIQERLRAGEMKKTIAADFGVCSTTVSRWAMTEEQRKEYHKRINSYPRKNKLESTKKAYKRKKELFSDLIDQYNHTKNNSNYAKKADYYRAKHKAYYISNKEKIAARQKKHHWQNRDRILARRKELAILKTKPV